MKYKKTIYLSKQAEEELKKICELENRTISNVIEHIIREYKPKSLS